LFKQWGKWKPVETADGDYTFEPVGKHNSGRELAGVEWLQFPEEFDR
jgi:hypothetical protein